MADDQPSELLLTVPAELVRDSKGLALDMGGSALKFVYRTKEDIDRVGADESGFGHIRLVSFSRSNVKQGLEYLRTRVHLASPKNENDQVAIYTTGVGCTVHGKLICETLNIRLENTTEFDCFVKAFKYLASRLPRHLLLEPFITEALDEPLDYMAGQLKVFASPQASSISGGVKFDEAATVVSLIAISGRPPIVNQASGETPIIDAEPDIYPCLLAMCGSGCGFMKMEKYGSFSFVDASNRGGKSFVAIGMLLTGCENFEELIELAQNGNCRNVDQTSIDLFSKKQSAEGDNSIYEIYSQVSGDADKSGLVYCFGKAAVSQNHDFRREDLAAAWLQCFVLDLVQVVHNACWLKGIRRVFFCGGFPSHRHVRHQITMEFARRNMFMTTLHQDPNATVIFDFVIPGQHLGALGSLIHGLEKN